MKISPILIIFGCAGLFMTMAISVQAQSSETDAFVRNASIAGEFEIESSRLALEKSNNPDIKSFAQMMIDDHTKVAAQLKSTVASTEDVDPAQVNDKLDAKHKLLIDKLMKANGSDFDHKYITDQVDGHKEAVTLFSNYSKDGDNAKIKDFATQTLPTLRMHLKHAKALKS